MARHATPERAQPGGRTRRALWTALCILAIIVGLGGVALGSYIFATAHATHAVEVDGSIADYREITINGAYDHNELKLDGDRHTYTLIRSQYHPALPLRLLQAGKIQLWVNQGSSSVVAVTLYNELGLNPIAYTTDAYDHPVRTFYTAESEGVIAAGGGGALALIALLWLVVATLRRRRAPARSRPVASPVPEPQPAFEAHAGRVPAISVAQRQDAARVFGPVAFPPLPTPAPAAHAGSMGQAASVGQASYPSLPPQPSFPRGALNPPAAPVPWPATNSGPYTPPSSATDSGPYAPQSTPPTAAPSGPYAPWPAAPMPAADYAPEPAARLYPGIPTPAQAAPTMPAPRRTSESQPAGPATPPGDTRGGGTGGWADGFAQAAPSLRPPSLQPLSPPLNPPPSTPAAPTSGGEIADLPTSHTPIATPAPMDVSEAPTTRTPAVGAPQSGDVSDAPTERLAAAPSHDAFPLPAMDDDGGHR
jgi:hypothetical protein